MIAPSPCSEKPYSVYPGLRDAAGGKISCGIVMSEVARWTDWKLGEAGVRLEMTDGAVIGDMEERAGFFFRSRAQWHDETGLSRTELETARRRLRAGEYIEESRKGHSPGTLHYRATPKGLQLALDMQVPLRNVVRAPQAAAGIQVGRSTRASLARQANRAGAAATATIDLPAQGEAAEIAVVLAPSLPPEPRILHPLVIAMVEIGVTESVAENLLQHHGEDEVSRQIAALAYRKPRDPAAELRTAIEKKYALPTAHRNAMKAERRAARRAEQMAHNGQQMAHNGQQMAHNGQQMAHNGQQMAHNGPGALGPTSAPQAATQPPEEPTEGGRAIAALTPEDLLAVKKQAQDELRANPFYRRTIDQGKPSPVVEALLKARCEELALELTKGRSAPLEDSS